MIRKGEPAQLSGTAEFVAKPINSEQIAEAIYRILGRGKDQKQRPLEDHDGKDCPDPLNGAGLS